MLLTTDGNKNTRRVLLKRLHTCLSLQLLLLLDQFGLCLHQVGFLFDGSLGGCLGRQLDIQRLHFVHFLGNFGGFGLQFVFLFDQFLYFFFGFGCFVGGGGVSIGRGLFDTVFLLLDLCNGCRTFWCVGVVLRDALDDNVLGSRFLVGGDRTDWLSDDNWG